MRNRSRVGALAAVSLLVSGCALTSRTINVARLGPAHQILVYEGGRTIVDRPIAAGSPDEEAVRTWLHTHADGWRSTYVTYAPDRSVRGGDFNLNFGGGSCVMNYRANEKEDWMQVIRTTDKNDPVPDVFAIVRPQR